jgi:hypothetical protein
LSDTVFTHYREHITFTPFTASDRISALDLGPERVTIRTQDGRIVEERVNPRESFPTTFDAASTPWDAIQVAYFTSAAVWNYLTEPFVFTQPRFRTDYDRRGRHHG